MTSARTGREKTIDDAAVERRGTRLLRRPIVAGKGGLASVLKDRSRGGLGGASTAHRRRELAADTRLPRGVEGTRSTSEDQTSRRQGQDGVLLIQLYSCFLGNSI